MGSFMVTLISPPRSAESIHLTQISKQNMHPLLAEQRFSHGIEHLTQIHWDCDKWKTATQIRISISSWSQDHSHGLGFPNGSFFRTFISVMHFPHIICEHELIPFSQYWSVNCARFFFLFFSRREQTEQRNGAAHISPLLSLIEEFNWWLHTHDILC